MAAAEAAAAAAAVALTARAAWCVGYDMPAEIRGVDRRARERAVTRKGGGEGGGFPRGLGLEKNRDGLHAFFWVWRFPGLVVKPRRSNQKKLTPASQYDFFSRRHWTAVLYTSAHRLHTDLDSCRLYRRLRTACTPIYLHVYHSYPSLYLTISNTRLLTLSLYGH